MKDAILLYVLVACKLGNNQVWPRRTLSLSWELVADESKNSLDF